MTSAQPDAGDISRHMKALTGFVENAANRTLPKAVALKGKLHLLDTLASMVSGTTLEPGKVAIDFANRQSGLGKASIVGTQHRVPCVTAAFVNGMLAHADETDDSHADSTTHPGCAVVPAALAYAEIRERTGKNLLNAVVAGYEVGARINMSLDPNGLRSMGHGPHSIGGHWGAGSAAGALCGFSAQEIRYLFSYVAQQTAGVCCWMRDQGHILKAFVFGGMPSRNGAFAAEMVENGFTGIDDVMEGKGNFLFAFSNDPKPEMISRGLGEDYVMLTTAIKKWTVGSPIQGALDALLAIMTEHRIGPGHVARIRVRVPDFAAHVVDNREIPDINLQHCLALMLIDGTLTFASSHDHARMSAPDVAALRALIEIVPDAELAVAVPARQAVVELDTRDGGRFCHRTYSVRGTPGDPMTVEEVVAKATELMVPVIGVGKTDELVDTVMSIEKLANSASLGRYWS